MTEDAIQPAGPKVSRWPSYLTVSPIKTLATFALTSGGLLVLASFLRVGFMPDIDLQTSTALLFAAAFVGLGTAGIYMLIAVLPGAMTAYSLSECKVAPQALTLASVCGAAVLMTLAIVADAWLASSRLLPAAPWIVWVAAAAGVLFVAMRVAYLRARAKHDERRDNAKGYLETAFLLSGSSFLWLMGLLTALKLALYLARESSQPFWLSGVLIGVWLLLLVAVNLLTAFLPMRSALMFAPIAAVPVFGVLMLFSDGFDGLSVHALRRLGLVEVEHVDLIVRADVCKSLRLTSSTDLRCDGSSGGDAGVLRDVVLRSRIGAQVVVEPSNPVVMAAPAALGGQTYRAARVVLKKEDVLLWTKR